MNKARIKGITCISLMAVMMALSCNKDNREELFELNYHVDFEIQPGLNTLDTHIYDISPLVSTLEDRLEASGHTMDEIVAIEAKEADLASIFTDVNLDYINRVSVLIYDTFNPADKIEFFYLDPVPPKDKTVIHLFPGIADIREWIERDYFGIEIRLNFRQVSPGPTEMRLEFDLRVMGK